MKFTMISTLAAALAIVSAAPTPADEPEHLPGSKPLFPQGALTLSVTTAGTELAGYLPNLVVGYTGEVLISKQTPRGFDQPVLTGWRGVSFDNLDFGAYYYLTVHTKESLPVKFEDKEGCPAPNISSFFDRNYDDKLYNFQGTNTPLNLWKACPDDKTSEHDYTVYWDSNNSISTTDSRKCIKIDIHVTDLSGRT